jgi:hypothetical protein
MLRALKSTGCVVAGFIAACAVMMFVEFINGRVLYPGLAKQAEGVTDRETIRAIFAAAPTGALLVVVFGWALGGLVGGWVAARLAGRSGVTHGVVVGAVLLLFGVANNLMLPPPLWFWCASLVVLVPAAYIGASLAPSR